MGKSVQFFQLECNLGCVPKVLELVIIFCGVLVVTGQSWPYGTYGLPQSVSGCPDGDGVKWSTGWRKECLRKNPDLKETHLNASLLPNDRGIQRSFCMKTIASSNKKSKNTTWPAGRYCIFKFGKSCPENMSSGYIRWKDVKNPDEIGMYGGVLPKGKYKRDKTEIHYCCRTDGNINEAIELPTDKPFYLLPYEQAECQMVKWTVKRSAEVIKYYTQESNENVVMGSHGHVILKANRSLITAYYCYYEGCKYEYSNLTGAFSSSISYHQICSWKIFVKSASFISLSFTLMEIPNCDLNSLDIFDGYNGKGKLLRRYCGSNATNSLTINSTGNSLYVVLRTGGNFDGSREIHVRFKAEYKAIGKEMPKDCRKIVNLTNANDTVQNISWYPYNSYLAIPIKCSWKIIVKEKRQISLKIFQVFLPKSRNPGQNYLKIFDGPNATFPLNLSSDWDNFTQGVLSSTGKTLYIVFKTADIPQYHRQRVGFVAKFNITKVSSPSSPKPTDTTTHLYSTTARSSRKPTQVSTPSSSTAVPNEIDEEKPNDIKEFEIPPLRKAEKQRARQSSLFLTVFIASFMSLILFILVVVIVTFRRRPFFVKTVRNVRYSWFKKNDRKGTDNPIYERTIDFQSSSNPLYASSSVSLYEEIEIQKILMELNNQTNSLRAMPVGNYKPQYMRGMQNQ